MANSPEYPDLTWMPPKSWRNADRSAVQVIVIHDTEGSEGINSAEDGAAYDQRRTDGTSTHYFHDQDTTVQCVRTEDVAFAARTQGNLRGIQHELCGRAGQGAAGWADVASQGTIRQAARQVARDCRKWDIPVRRITPAQLAAGVKGIVGHVDVTAAFPQDGGTHTDPGPTFPWANFLNLVDDFLNGDDVSLKDDVLTLGITAATELFGLGADGKPKRTTASASELIQLNAIYAHRAAVQAGAAANTGVNILTNLASRPDVDNAEIAAHLAPILAPLIAAQIHIEGGAVVDQAELEAALRKVLGSVDNT